MSFAPAYIAGMRLYKGYTLEEAQNSLQQWKAAKAAAATGKSYKIGSRELTRYNLGEIDKQISFFADIAKGGKLAQQFPAFYFTSYKVLFILTFQGYCQRFTFPQLCNSE